MFILNPDESSPGQKRLREMTLAAFFAALAVLLSPLSFPAGPARCFPIQHAVNVAAGITLGPLWACGAAFVASLIRHTIGTGTILAFPGSMFGALAVGIAARFLPARFRLLAFAAEPLATATLGAGTAALIISPGSLIPTFYSMSLAFFISSGPGAVVGGAALGVLRRSVASLRQAA